MTGEREVGPRTHAPDLYARVSLDGPRPHYVFPAIGENRQVDRDVVIEEFDLSSLCELFLWRDREDKLLNYLLTLDSQISQESIDLLKSGSATESDSLQAKAIKSLRPFCTVSPDEGMMLELPNGFYGITLFRLTCDKHFEVSSYLAGDDKPIADGSWHGTLPGVYRINFTSPPYFFEATLAYFGEFVQRKGSTIRKEGLFVSGIEFAYPDFTLINARMQGVINEGILDERKLREIVNPYFRLGTAGEF
ncbi:hypothetical protein A2697_03910 [Candidatus Curtissbacteria bacterium RIFCSPHIGHO2_01_FULL_41_44]|uniref:Uncharacterized protein n=1 Tax=Candidatus Curtissbacteria bacterium RIFCSPLOWO2_01_FULL_42_50 TaxID=1797730 RepID=A0A1F5H7N0_9BACT|nr:MAG: hypothetical protein A2697_03910 [Candidatus Curtissbacteria bacterium RIFCSPHIGHO2_01_FULL_41_44]OGD94312.1 MAG: hypothetical protein A3C33_03075 [Candidatus Curtissbacteria bacterium RIFCSPHIGHO2_02_FULL_42_58]OGD97786.1 MAG: hypothetical protein A3E71_03585 [Candidatus Curtissbacteria bacterium RIFCSPHIGHO2_12_FULL_42_33]OGE00177.1 MAG: hypothetical protein A3B54_02125 [Candidatus Curtissbacteria bacterium RIFCSPLOWO2_01_FULL_42_50]OGE02104.1 MAG: hypothetical protein A3G16_00440 [Ca